MTLLSIDTHLLQKPSHGAHYKNGKAIFSLWAPDAQQVTLAFSDGRLIPLDLFDGGWFSRIVACRPGAEYRFIIDNNFTVPDPAAYAQSNDEHEWSKVIDHSAYQWKMHNWCGKPWYQCVIYKVHAELLGGFSGIKQQLPALVELGVSAIELMPSGEFVGEHTWSRNGALPFAPECSYGTPDELKALIDYAHQLGLMVFVGVVYDHLNAKGNAIARYASSFFRQDIKSSRSNASDFRCPQVQQYFSENALMWVRNYRVDGLRFAAAHAINDNDFLIQLARRLNKAVPYGRYIHLMLENNNNSTNLLEHGFIAQWNDDGHKVLHHLLTGETQGDYRNFSDSPTTKLARCLREGFIYQGDTCGYTEVRGEASAHLSPLAFLLYLHNPDQPGTRVLGERLSHLANPNNLKAAVTLMLLCPMVPLLVMGEDLGLDQVCYFPTDGPDRLNNATGESGCSEFLSAAIFQQAEKNPLLELNNIATFSASKPVPRILNQAQQEWRRFYRTLLRLRSLEIIPRLPGTFSTEVIILGAGAVSAFWELGDGSKLRIDLNFGDVSVENKRPWNRGRVLFNQGVDHLSYMENCLPKHCALVTLDDGYIS